MLIRKDWNLRRVINDGAPLSGTLTIRCTSPRNYLWEEHIISPTEEGQEIEGYQSYRIERNGALLEVFYHTGPQKNKIFQIFNLKSPDDKAPHMCGEDLYESTLFIPSRSEIHVTHSVTGPTKNYVMKTVYRVM